MKTHGKLRNLSLATLLAAGLAISGCGSQAIGTPTIGTPTVGTQAVGTTVGNQAVGHQAKPHTALVCAGVTNCHLIGARDVDGDGQADQIGWRQISDRSVQIRVRVAPRQVLTSTVDVTLWWGGGAWGGATPVDNVRGVELLVGSMQGAHTPMYTMLTYRSGKLVVENSPSALSPLWQIDAADGDYMGWWRQTLQNGHIAMTQKIAVRIGSGTHFRGHNVTYVWTDGAWVRTASSTHHYATGQQASLIAGFHVPGLKKFPGIG